MDLENAVAGQTVPTADVSGERFARAQKATGQEKQQAQAPNPSVKLWIIRRDEQRRSL
jgi:hypothetical protein